MPNYKNSVWSETATAHPHPTLDRDLEVDVVVVGAGITGVTAAVLLKRAGRKVALIESRRVGKGETGKTTAHLTEVLDTRFHKLISHFGTKDARLAVEAQRAAINRIAAFVNAENIRCQFERVPGYLYAETADQAETVEKELKAAHELGVNAVSTNAVPLPFPVVRALRVDDQAQFDPRAYLLTLAARIEGNGSHIFEQAHVVDIEEDESGCRVTTEKATIVARSVVVAAHAPIAKNVLIHTKLAAYRTYAIAMPIPTQQPQGLFWDTADPYHYIRTHVVNGVPHLIVGGEDHKVGEEEDTSAAFERLEAYVASHFGHAPPATAFRWSGQIIESTDGLPYIGRNSTGSRIFVATGYSGNGMTNGTLAAMLLCDEITEIANPWSHIFDATRFKPIASATAFVRENIDFPKHLITDRMVRAHRPPDLESLPAGEGMVVNVDGNKLAVYRNGQGGLSACSAVCTHLGCLVHWNVTEKSWDCPCHGSRFDPTGRVLNGPATEPLEQQALADPLTKSA